MILFIFHLKNLILYIITITLVLPITLQEAYNEAGPGNGYDKYVVLEINLLMMVGYICLKVILILIVKVLLSI